MLFLSLGTQKNLFWQPPHLQVLFHFNNTTCLYLSLLEFLTSMRLYTIFNFLKNLFYTIGFLYYIDYVWFSVPNKCCHAQEYLILNEIKVFLFDLACSN